MYILGTPRDAGARPRGGTAVEPSRGPAGTSLYKLHVYWWSRQRNHQDDGAVDL